jgi:hypothetical protein
VTTGVLELAHTTRQVTRIDVVEPGTPADLCGAKKRCGRSIIGVSHLVVLVESCDVPRYGGRDIRQELGDLRQLRV